MFDISEIIITSTKDITDSDSSIITLNCNNGEKLSKYQGGGYCLRHGLVISGSYLLSADETKPLIHAWSLNNTQCGSAGQLLTSKARCIDATEEIGYIAVGAVDSIQLYEMCSGRLVANVGKKFQPVNIIKFSKDGCLIACASLDGVIIIWNTGSLLANGEISEPLFVFEGHRLGISDLKFTSGGLRSKIISVSTDQTLKVHDLVSGSLISSVVYNIGLTALELHMNENHVFIGNKIGGIHLLPLNLTNIQRERHLTIEEQNQLFNGHIHEITALSCSLHQPLLVSGSIDGAVKIWDILTYTCLRTVENKGPVTNVLFTLVADEVLEKSYKPPVTLPQQCVQYNIVSDTKSEEIITSHDMIQPVIKNVTTVRKEKKIEDPELVKLKSINEALYLFSVKRILNKPLRFNVMNKEEMKVNKKKSRIQNKKKSNMIIN